MTAPPPLSPTAQRAVDHLVAAARPLILQHAIPASCIGSTRVAVDYLREQGVAARPLSVRLQVLNPMHTAYRIAAKDDEHVAAELQALREDERAYREAGLWSVGLGYSRLAGDPVSARGWDGHVVCIVENRLLLDLSLDQVNRPNRGIELGPLAVPVTQAWLTSGNPSELIERRCLLLYQALPDDRSFEHGPDWTRPERWEPVLNALRDGAFGARSLASAKGRGRNQPCPCNSGQKAKRCCHA